MWSLFCLQVVAEVSLSCLSVNPLVFYLWFWYYFQTTTKRRKFSFRLFMFDTSELWTSIFGPFSSQMTKISKSVTPFSSIWYNREFLIFFAVSTFSTTATLWSQIPWLHSLLAVVTNERNVTYHHESRLYSWAFESHHPLRQSCCSQGRSDPGQDGGQPGGRRRRPRLPGLPLRGAGGLAPAAAAPHQGEPLGCGHPPHRRYREGGFLVPARRPCRLWGDWGRFGTRVRGCGDEVPILNRNGSARKLPDTIILFPDCIVYWFFVQIFNQVLL